jgi:RNA polymerase sigma factor (sigma-70 family)
MKDQSALWDRLRQGDEKALGIIYNDYFEVLINYGLRLSPHHEVVEDSVQDLFVDIWNLRANLSPTDSIKNYLICSFRRKLFKKLKQKINTTDDGVLETEISEDQHFLSQMIESEEFNDRAQKLGKVMESLSHRQREAIFLKYNEGMDYEAICEAMDLKYQSVRNLISTAIIRIRENLPIKILLLVIIEYIYKGYSLSHYGVL